MHATLADRVALAARRERALAAAAGVLVMTQRQALAAEQRLAASEVAATRRRIERELAMLGPWLREWEADCPAGEPSQPQRVVAAGSPAQR